MNIICKTNHKLNIRQTVSDGIVVIESVSPLSIDKNTHYIFIHQEDIPSIISNLSKFQIMKTKTTTKKTVKKTVKKAANKKSADRKAAPRAKRVRIEVQMTDKEKKQVTKKAKSLGVTITNFIKNLLFRKINF